MIFGDWKYWHDVSIDSFGLMGSMLSITFFVIISKINQSLDSEIVVIKMPTAKTSKVLKFQLISKIKTMKKLRKNSILESLFLISLVITLVPSVSNQLDNQTQIALEPEENLLESVIKYESLYVAQNEDFFYGYSIDIGYPMYLFSIGEMYYWLYNHTKNEYYLDKLIRSADYVERIRNQNWVWLSSRWSAPSSLYSSMAISLFLKCYQITKDIDYLSDARNTLNDTISLEVVKPEGTNNDKFLLFTVISEFLLISGNENDFFLNSGLAFFEYAMSQYNLSTKEWYYTTREQDDNFYDGHSAYYQLGNIYNFLKRSNSISTIYPEEFEFINNEVNDMIPLIEKYITTNGTMFYNFETPDYTESAALILVTYEYLGSQYGYNREEITKSAINVILQRQLSNGAYLRTDELVDKYSLWYSDAIGERVALYLCLTEISSL